MKDEWVLPFEVIPIIDIPGYGDKAAAMVCEQLKVQSQNDTVKLAEAKQMVYLKVGSVDVEQLGLRSKWVGMGVLALIVG